MKTSQPPPQHPAIAQITAKIEEFHALELDFKNDKTLVLAESALESAKAAAAAAEAEDDSLDPEELVDKRLEARREVEIAEIRLARARKAVESRSFDVNAPLKAGGEIAAGALREVAEPFGERLEAALRKLIGDEGYTAESAHYKSLIYRKRERLYGHARHCESRASIPLLNQAITLLEDAARLG
jgi:hypothetical protein